MSNRSNHPVSDTDPRGDTRADDGHGGFEEDPLVELARIVSEGNAKFRPVAMAEPRFEEPAVSPADDRYDAEPSDWDAALPESGGWDETAEQPYAEQSYAEPQYSGEAYADPLQPSHEPTVYTETYEPRVHPAAGVEPEEGDDVYRDAYQDTWQDQQPSGGWAEPDYSAEYPQEPQADWSEGPVNRSDDAAGGFDTDPHVAGAHVPHVEREAYGAEPAYGAPAGYSDDFERAISGGDGDRTRDLTANLSASLEDELLGAGSGAVDRQDTWSQDETQDEPFDDLLMDAPAGGWSEPVQQGHADPYAPSFEDEFYATADMEAPPPPEGYDLDAVAQAMREGDPQIGGHGVLPPHSALEQEAVPEEKSRRGLFAAAAVLGLVVAGGAVFALFDFGGGDDVGPPPVIAASDEPLKVYPEGEEPSANGQSKLIYDRVGGVETPREERLVVRDETPVASLPPAPVADGGAETRTPAGPRRVRTVVVRPDGTIISGDDEPSTATVASPAAPQDPAQPTQVQPTPAPSSPSQVASVNPNTDTRQVTTTPVTAPGATTSADANGDVNQASGATGANPTLSGDVPANVPRGKPGDIQTLAESAAPPPAIPSQAVASTRNTAAPLDLTTSQQAAPQAQPSAPASSGTIPAGAYVVQVSSQRTQDQAQAAFNNLQQRYAGVLGGVTPVIQRADLGDRGTFYRVRIPASSRDDAISLCERLKSAGGDCFVRRN